ncbi:MAG: cbb3-type cytochrome c oxidase subunit I [Desulfurococcales archaeon]|nr:cbb3-type cytochrome c oxidase subunit I [Desulfurococcales archaeon]
MSTWSWIKRWLTTTNHKDIGILYLVTSIYFFFVAGMLAEVFRVQLAVPEKEILTGSEFNQAVTIHGLLMLLWFMSPFQFALANYFVPLQIGARDLAFPRLNALSYWLYLFSGLLLIAGFFVPGGAADVGWTFYAPLTDVLYSPSKGVDLAGLAIVLLTASVTLGTINFLTTIIKLRAPGLTWSKLPMFTWSILFTVLLMLLAFPPLGAAAIMLVLDRNLGTQFFSSLEGGALLWDHMFWFFGHPEVYILLFPALGAAADIISVFARRQLYAKRFVIIALFIAVALSYLVWMHHMFITGTSLTVRKIFSVTTALISIPFEMAALALIVTLYKGRVVYRAPMLFSLAGIFHFIIGGATGVFQAAIILDRQFRGSYWVVAHFHYIMAGTVLFWLIAALYYWLPKMTGRMYNEKLARIHFILSVIGLNLLYFPQFLLMDMPRRIYTYNPEWKLLNQISTVGAVIYGLSFIVAAYVLYKAVRSGPKAPDNPWRAWGIEWSVPSPPPRHNYEGVPVIRSDNKIIFVDESEIKRVGLANIINAAAPGLSDIESTSQISAATQQGSRVHSTHGEAHVAHHEHSTMMPFIIGLGVFIALLGAAISPLIMGSNFTLTIIGFLIFLAGVIKWAYDDLNDRFSEPEPEYKEDWPFVRVDKLRLAMWTFIAGEGFLFGSLISAYLFIRSRSLTWPPGYELHDPIVGLINTIILFTGTMLFGLGYLEVRRGKPNRALLYISGTLVMALLFMTIKAIEWGELAEEGYTINSILPIQLYYTLTGAHGAHVIAGIVATIYAMVKIISGGYNRNNYKGLLLLSIYWGIVEIVWTFLFPLFYLM